MTPRSKLLALWTLLGALAAAIALPLAGPLAVAWQCYGLYRDGAREPAQVLHKLDAATFALLISEGPHAGTACTADTSPEIFDATRVGDTLEVVHLETKPGECELASTIEASARLLWLISAAAGLVVLGLLAVGVALTRSLTRPADPVRPMAVDPGED